jgi:hypothetical protein
MLLREILDLHPLPYKWLSPTVGSFEFNGKLFGIVLEEYQLTLQTREVSTVNISFGIVMDVTQPISSTNINRELTGFGQPRTIMTTVANACVDNPELLKNDILIVAASDQVKQKRIGVYTLAISELATRLRQYQYSYRAHTPSGSILVVTSKVELTQDEVEFIGKEVLGK